MSEWRKRFGRTQRYSYNLVYCDLELYKETPGSQWRITCSELAIEEAPFGYGPLEEVKAQALAFIRVKLERMLAAVKSKSKPFTSDATATNQKGKE